jgi:hypothetical protein
MSHLDDYEEIYKQWAKAESLLKKVEHISGKAPIPAINELRYSGFQLISMLISPTVDLRERNYHLMIDHIKRSIRDSLELGIEIMLNRIANILDNYRAIPITDVIKEYPEMKSTLIKIQTFFLNKNRYTTEDNHKYLENMEEYLNELLNIYNIMNAAQEPLARVLKRWRIQIIVWVSTIVIILSGVIIAILNYLK